MLKRLALILSVAYFTAVAGGCSEQGPAEEAGEQIDETMEETKEKAEEAMEEAGDKIEEMGDKVEENTDN